MPQIIPIKDLKNTSEVSELCHSTSEPIFITKNGYGDMVLMSMETFEKQQAQIELYGKLSIAEQEIANGAEGEDFANFAKELRGTIHGRL